MLCVLSFLSVTVLQNQLYVRPSPGEYRFQEKRSFLFFFFHNSAGRSIMTTDLTASAILKEGNTAVITGASSGIGRAAAMYCASQGMNVWMADIDEEELAAARGLVESKALASGQVCKTCRGDAHVVNNRILT